MSSFVLDRTCANLHAPTTKPVFPMVGDIPVSVRIPDLKEGNAMKVCYIATSLDAVSARPGGEKVFGSWEGFSNLGRSKCL